MPNRVDPPRRAVSHGWGPTVALLAGCLLPHAGLADEPWPTTTGRPVVEPVPAPPSAGPVLLPPAVIRDPAAARRAVGAGPGPIDQLDWEGILSPLPGLPAAEPARAAAPAAATRWDTAEPLEFCWAPHNLYHRATYFEDLPLERYGWTRPWGLQPLASTGKFLGDALLWPLRWGKEWPGRPHFVLGHARAGSPAPRVVERWLP